MFNTECKKTVSKMILSFILITATLLSGCQKNTTNSANLNSNQEKEQVYFDATVLEVKKKSIKVKCSESFDSGIPVDEEFSVTTNRVESGELPDLNAGDHIRIAFDGIIKESYPLQLGNVFAIYLLDENGNL